MYESMDLWLRYVMLYTVCYISVYMENASSPITFSYYFNKCEHLAMFGIKK